MFTSGMKLQAINTQEAELSHCGLKRLECTFDNLVFRQKDPNRPLYSFCRVKGPTGRWDTRVWCKQMNAECTIGRELLKIKRPLQRKHISSPWRIIWHSDLHVYRYSIDLLHCRLLWMKIWETMYRKETQITHVRATRAIKLSLLRHKR